MIQLDGAKIHVSQTEISWEYTYNIYDIHGINTKEYNLHANFIDYLFNLLNIRCIGYGSSNNYKAYLLENKLNQDQMLYLDDYNRYTEFLDNKIIKEIIE